MKILELRNLPEEMFEDLERLHQEDEKLKEDIRIRKFFNDVIIETTNGFKGGVYALEKIAEVVDVKYAI